MNRVLFKPAFQWAVTVGNTKLRENMDIFAWNRSEFVPMTHLYVTERHPCHFSHKVSEFGHSLVYCCLQTVPKVASHCYLFLNKKANDCKFGPTLGYTDF